MDTNKEIAACCRTDTEPVKQKVWLGTEGRYGEVHREAHRKNEKSS